MPNSEVSSNQMQERANHLVDVIELAEELPFVPHPEIATSLKNQIEQSKGPTHE